jgi:hypothetical protein
MPAADVVFFFFFFGQKGTKSESIICHPIFISIMQQSSRAFQKLGLFTDKLLFFTFN